MRSHVTKSFLFVAGLLLVSGSLWAHHGQGLSFDTNHMWTTWGTIEEFDYINPHPAIKFSRTDKNGNVEHWGAEVSNNPSRLARVGWTKSRCLAALQPGTRVKLYVGTSLAGGRIGIVELMESEKGELLCSERESAHKGHRSGRRSRTAISPPTKTGNKNGPTTPSKGATYMTNNSGLARFSRHAVRALALTAVPAFLLVPELRGAGGGAPWRARWSEMT